MNGIIKSKAFYKTMLGLMLPIALQNMISTGVGIMDTVMLGSFGDATLSGASLGNQPFFMLNVVVFGAASGAGVLISQYWGRGNHDIAGRIIAISMRFILLISAMVTAACLLFPESVIRIFNSEPDVVALGAKYLGVVAFSYIPSAISTCYLVSLRAVGRAGFSTAVYGASFFINIFFNYCFIFGSFGFPRLEVMGAAVGTIIARCFELLCVIIYVALSQKIVPFKWSGMFRREKQLTADFLRTALPVTGSEFMWSLGTLVSTMIIGHIGKIFVTASSIANIVQQVGMVMMFGVGNATAVLVGKAVGRGDNEQAKAISKTMLLVSLGVGLIACLLVQVLREPFLSLYNVSAEAASIANEMMKVMSVLLLMSGLEITSIIGILRGGGDTKYAFRVDCGSMWLVSVPLGLLAGFVLKLDPIYVYILMRCDLPVRLVFCLTRIFSGKFIKNVTREQI